MKTSSLGSAQARWVSCDQCNQGIIMGMDCTHEVGTLAEVVDSSQRLRMLVPLRSPCMKQV